MPDPSWASGIASSEVKATVRATCFRGDAASATDADVAAFLSVCRHYNLNPFLRQIHAFKSKSTGAIHPIVGIDGWVSLVNREPRFAGVELVDVIEGGKLVACEAIFQIKDSGPVVVREYLSECFRNTEPWQKWPRRMLRHKAYIQGARIAFGLSGLRDPDELERIEEAVTTVQPRSLAQSAALAETTRAESPAQPPLDLPATEREVPTGPGPEAAHEQHAEPSPLEQAWVRVAELQEAKAVDEGALAAHCKTTWPGITRATMSLLQVQALCQYLAGLPDAGKGLAQGKLA